MNSVDKRLKIESTIKNLHIVENAIDEITASLGINQDNYGKILVATLEAVNNAIVHGNEGNPKRIVEIEIFFQNNEMRITVSDEGPGFDPESIPDPTMPQYIEELSGRGVFLMKKLADEIKFNDKGNSVTMTFKEVTS